MEEFWVLILVAFFATNSFDKAESVQLEELPLQTFDELFGEDWWDKEKAEEWHKLTLEQNFLHQIDRQNTQIGQIEPNSTDQNPLLTESDHSNNAKNDEEQKEITSNKKITENEQKSKIIDKFNAMKKEFKQQGKYSAKGWNQIEQKIAKNLKVNRKNIYKWKKEFSLTQKMDNIEKKKNEQTNVVEKFYQKKAELLRDGFKNSYHHEIDKTVAKELGLNFGTIYRWKSELDQTKPQHNHNEQKELMKSYYEIKDKNPKMNVGDIAKMLKIGTRTLYNWKKQFKRQQFHPNSVDGQAAANVQEIEKTNSGSI